ncbi:site-2 protease family protein [Halobacteriovorax sp. GB3]|uniref:site-2 protease family protein n=1 Tax=Halobacteriovorax sp. GB3 TaxID=2719615 RepID=UPI002361A9A3|nr:site-2 protease family protein [Halobacteriovorax sp. GB3]MDD0852583.1 site-2 protease family protein [Halobacteriovorax sp. GB3]
MDFTLMFQKIAIALPGFLLAVVCHEVAHGVMALKHGDDTARNEGRLTLNPAAHFDTMGSLVIPLVIFASTGFLFGWAKPVPVNPVRFKNFRSGMFWVSFAGPLTNFILALISAILFAAIIVFVDPQFYLFEPFVQMLSFSAMINMALGVFNLIPLPPLDGSKMVQAFLDYNSARKFEALGQYSFFIIIGLMLTGGFHYIFAPGQILINKLQFFFMYLFSQG